MLGVLVAIVLVLYRDTWMSLVHTWRVDTTFSHGFLILPMSLYLVWTKRRTLAAMDTGPSWIGLLPLALSAGVWVLGALVNVRPVEQLAFVGMLQSLVLLAFGTAVTRVLLFPLAYLLFMVPIGSELVPPLMEVTADLSVALLNLTGVPVYRDDMLLYIPAGTYEVARACSGVKFLTAAVAIGTFYAYVMYAGWRKRLAFVALAIVVAILSNGVRAYLLVLIGHLTDMRFEHDRWHIVLGYVVFSAILLLLLHAGARFRDEPRPAPAITRSPGIRPAGFQASLQSVSLLLAAAGIVVLAAQHAARVAGTGGSASMIEAMSSPIVTAGAWAVRHEEPAWRPSVSGGVARNEGTYGGKFGDVELFVEVFSLPSGSGAEMISYHNRIEPNSNERLYRERLRTVELGGGRVAAVVREIVVGRSAPRLVWYWYDVAGRPAINGVRAKLLEVAALLRNGSGAQRIVVISTDLDSRATAEERLRDFLALHAEQLGVMDRSL